MKFPIFASFILFGLWLTFALSRTRRKSQKASDSFWEREALANSTRKKPLDGLLYITIPYDSLPFSLIPGKITKAASVSDVGPASDTVSAPDAETVPDVPADIDSVTAQIMDCHRILHGLGGKKIVNLTGITNTDLKLAYGAPNITLLTEYDQNYTMLVRTMQKWADLLIRAGYTDEAIPIMEFCVETRTDISATYRTLANIYRERGEADKIAHLREIAQELNSAMRPAILRMLDDAGSSV